MLNKTDINLTIAELNASKTRLNAVLKLFTEYSKGLSITKGDLLSAGYKNVVFVENDGSVNNEEIVNLEEYADDFEVKTFYYNTEYPMRMYIERK